ncbi:MAG: hypothetical protein M1830_007860 [Pleopsidium flavum]|nr:MAG: hypothetical protein M1830_007860 [Pleopsidium flavum]
MTLREEVVLAPKDPQIEDDNQWPEFRLSEVTVYQPDGRNPTSLLAASNQSPVLVRGCLDEVDSDQERLVLNKTLLKQTIQLSKVKRFAYGQYDDGGVGIWAEGKAGWFAIEPAPEYKIIFDEMVEAIDILYFLVDRYKKTGTKRGHKDLKSTEEQSRSIFKKYVEHSNYIYDDFDDAAEAFYKHREFLIVSMLTGKEGIAWATSPFCRHMKQKFQDDFARIKTKLEHKQGDSKSEEEQGISPQPTKKSSTRSPQTYTFGGSEDPKPKKRMQEKACPDDEIAGKSVVDLRQRPHKRKSLLRPKSTKYANKGAGKCVSIGITDHDEDSDNQGSATVDLPLQRNKVTFRNTTAARDVKAELGLGDNSLLEPTFSGSEVLPKTQNTRAFTILEQPLPSTSPQGPGDTWTCTVDGCIYKVYQARKAKSQQMIKDHLKGHNFKARDKLNLVFEEERPHLPIR